MWEFIKHNPELCLIALYLLGKLIVRITPTKKDNAIFGVIEGIIVRYWLKIPNRKKGGGKFDK
jgi:hypothetical protein